MKFSHSKADHFASHPQAMLMLLDDMLWQLSWHHCQQWSDGDTLWFMPSQSTVAAKLVAGLKLCLYFFEQCQCSSRICSDDGNGIAIPSPLSRIRWHILCLAVTKFSHTKLRLLGRSLCLSSSSNNHAPSWHAMITELSSQPARIGWQYPVVHAVMKHSCSQVGCWTDTLSLLSWAMFMLLNNMQWW